MRYNHPHKDWERCTECGQFTSTTKAGCQNCGDVDQDRVGGWQSEYYE